MTSSIDELETRDCTGIEVNVCWMGLNMQSLESCIAMDVNVDDDLLNAILNLISLIAAIDEFMLMQLIQIDQC